LMPDPQKNIEASASWEREGDTFRAPSMWSGG